MRRLRHCFLPLLCVVPLLAQTSDSISYFKVRDSIAALPHPASESVLRAAGELADMGLYRDAYLLLLETARTSLDSAIVSPEPASPETSLQRRNDAPRTRSLPATSWRVTGAADYTHLEDLANADTSQPEKKDSLARLRENPLIVSSKASLSWKNAAPLITTVDPSLYISNQKAALDFAATFSPARMLSIEAGVKTEKRLMNRRVSAGDPLAGSSQPTVFVGDRKDSLDMIGGRTTVNLTTGNEDAVIGFEAPLTVEGCRYRGGRIGYYSYNDYRAAPSVSFSSRDMRKNANLRFLGEYKNYKGGGGGPVSRADSLDIYRAGPEISGELWLGRSSGAATVGFLYERYPHRGIPHRVRTTEAETRLRTKPLPPLEASLIARYENRIEEDRGRLNYFKDTTKIVFGVPVPDTAVIRQFDASFRLRGHDAEMTPALRYTFASLYAAEVRCPVRLRAFPVIETVDGKQLTVPAFILESLAAFEPELGFEFSETNLDIRITGAYTVENVPARDYYTLSSNRGWKTGADFMGNIAKNLSFYAQLEFQYRRYASHDGQNRTSRNVQASSGIAFKW